MGFLDHSTNNIIVDAVLTDIGRQKLSQNDGSFSVVKFALGDDEIDYTIIKKFGLTVGREKIEKNTPIFEAQTGASYALKYKLLSMSSQVETHIPSLVNSDKVTSTVFLESLKRTGSENSSFTNISLSQVVGTGDSTYNIPIDMQESVFMIKASNRFLKVSTSAGNLPASYISQRDQMATYRVAASSVAISGANSPGITFSLSPKESLTQTVFNTFGDGNGVITTVVVVTGLLTGISHYLTVPIKYS